MSKAEESDSAPAPKSPRRSFLAAILAGAAVVSAGSAMAAPVNPDATLIALCREFLRVDAEDKAHWEIAYHSLEAEKAYEPRSKQVDAWIVRRTEMICELPAQTPEGLRLKAMVALSQAPRTANGEIDTTWDAEGLAWSLVSDMAAEHGRIVQ
jgi:hypothetical protein